MIGTDVWGERVMSGVLNREKTFSGLCQLWRINMAFATIGRSPMFAKLTFRVVGSPDMVSAGTPASPRICPLL